MIEQKETIDDDGSVKGTMSKDEAVIHYRVEGKLIDSGRSDGLDIMAEVRAAIMAELEC